MNEYGGFNSLNIKLIIKDVKVNDAKYQFYYYNKTSILCIKPDDYADIIFTGSSTMSIVTGMNYFQIPELRTGVLDDIFF